VLVQKNESAAYWALLGLSLAFSILAVVTLLPNGAASKPNVLGYRSVCSFAPTATLLCGVLAGLTCTIRNRRVSRGAASARYRPLIVPVGVGVLLLAGALVFGIRFGNAQARFGEVIAHTQTPSPAAAALADGTREASVTEGDVAATVEVTVRGGVISAARLVAGKNVDESLASELFKRVIAAGKTEVDAVSGATASSKVVLSAAARAAAGTP
jgi:uncharacterized protein with FMN-binding domain